MSVFVIRAFGQMREALAANATILKRLAEIAGIITQQPQPLVVRTQGPALAALVLTLPAGAYTAIVETPNGTPGVGIVELYRIN